MGGSNFPSRMSVTTETLCIYLLPIYLIDLPRAICLGMKKSTSAEGFDQISQTFAFELCQLMVFHHTQTTWTLITYLDYLPMYLPTTHLPTSSTLSLSLSLSPAAAAPAAGDQRSKTRRSKDPRPRTQRLLSPGCMGFVGLVLELGT